MFSLIKLRSDSIGLSQVEEPEEVAWDVGNSVELGRQKPLTWDLVLCWGHACKAVALPDLEPKRSVNVMSG